MTAISDLTLPAVSQTIRGIISHVPQGTIDRIPTTMYMIGDDSGDLKVIYAEDGSFSREMYELEDGQRVELTGVLLPKGRSSVDRFLALSGKRIK
jgi:hypothetical protein